MMGFKFDLDQIDQNFPDKSIFPENRERKTAWMFIMYLCMTGRTDLDFLAKVCPA